MPIESYSYQRGSFLKLTPMVRFPNRTGTSRKPLTKLVRGNPGRKGYRTNGDNSFTDPPGHGEETG